MMMGGELKIKELLMLLMLMLMIERNFFFVEDCCNFSCLYKHIARKGSRLKKILGRSFSPNFCGPMQLQQLQEEELFVLVLAFGAARAQQTKSNPFS
jgi:hypothetical protein